MPFSHARNSNEATLACSAARMAHDHRCPAARVVRMSVTSPAPPHKTTRATPCDARAPQTGTIRSPPGGRRNAVASGRQLACSHKSRRVFATWSLDCQRRALVYAHPDLPGKRSAASHRLHFPNGRTPLARHGERRPAAPGPVVYALHKSPEAHRACSPNLGDPAIHVADQACLPKVSHVAHASMSTLSACVLAA